MIPDYHPDVYSFHLSYWEKLAWVSYLIDGDTLQDKTIVRSLSAIQRRQDGSLCSSFPRPRPCYHV
jgi:hypothetical protein